ncbi:unannotated protein [freshwater metagenome]|uniref:Unannotated protein n=1 Tax=freshwater metagenome TaxID=449393 RepID=A0A6J6Z2A9_9ZZZZ
MNEVEIDVEHVGFAIGAMYDVIVPKFLRQGSRGHVLLLFERWTGTDEDVSPGRRRLRLI